MKRVLIVEDDTASRLLLTKVFKKNGYEVVSLKDGMEAVEVLKTQTFDAVFTDWLMPQLNGMELIKQIRLTVKPAPVIVVVTALASNDARNRAYEVGADDYITKPISIERVKEVLEYNLANKKTARENKNIPFKEKTATTGVVIAASTGGPSALMELVKNIEANDRASFFIVLHGPEWMLKNFSERLNSIAQMPVLLGEDKMKIETAKIYLAPGNKHMLINSQKGEIELNDDPPVNFVKPAADVLFKSAAHYFGSKTIGVVMTGMGKDGSTGCGYISAAKGYTIAQDPDSAALDSMPRTIIQYRIADIVLKLEDIATEINKKLKEIV